MTCTACDAEFEPRPDHRGKINVCLNCGGEDVEPLMATVAWENKQTPIIEVTTAKKARRFNALQQRHGHGPLKSITERREEPDERYRSNDKGGATPGATYRSPRGVFNVKR